MQTAKGIFTLPDFLSSQQEEKKANRVFAAEVLVSQAQVV